MIVIKKILLVRDNFPKEMLGVGIVAGWQYTNYRERQVMLTISKRDRGECCSFSISDGVNIPFVKFPFLATLNVFEEFICYPGSDLGLRQQVKILYPLDL